MSAQGIPPDDRHNHSRTPCGSAAPAHVRNKQRRRSPSALLTASVILAILVSSFIAAEISRSQSPQTGSPTALTPPASPASSPPATPGKIVILPPASNSRRPMPRSRPRERTLPARLPPAQPAPGAAVQPSPSGGVEVTGQVSCDSGNSVEGVWVAAATGSGWASWMGLGNGSTSDYWYRLPEGEPYALHVGCGGSPSSWRVANYTPPVGGTHNSFNCQDVPGKPDYTTCTLR
jgi:hypothetical protein